SQRPASTRMTTDKEFTSAILASHYLPFRAEQGFVTKLGRNGKDLEAVPCRTRYGAASLFYLFSVFVITPHAMRSPALPLGSVFMSSALAWITSAVPPLLKREWLSVPRFTSSLFMVRNFALPFLPTVKLFMS